jgi:tetratricopeptide (TPR) repeat protein
MKVLVAIILLVYSLDAAAQIDNEHLQNGIKKAGDGDHEGALGDFTRAIETMYANVGFAYYYRGRAHAELWEHDEAIADFTKAIELEPNAPFIDPYNY